MEYQDVIAQFQIRAATNPDRTAVEDCAGRNLSYRALDQLSTVVADLLKESGVCFGQLVPFLTDRSCDWPAAVFGILKAGCSFVPVDPSWPEQRQQRVIQECGSHVVVLAGVADSGLGVRTIEVPQVPLGERKLNEFAILIQARLWTSQIEWFAHYPLAIKAGLSESVAADLKEGKRPSGMQPDEALVYDLCMELSTKHFVSDATYKRARELFSEQQVVDLVMVSGVYVSVAMLANTAEEGVPAGKTPPLQPLPSER